MATIRRFSTDQNIALSMLRLLDSKFFKKEVPYTVGKDLLGDWYQIIEEPEYKYDAESGFWIPSF